MKEKVPTWLKLDNAATIYPSTLSRNYAAMFRVSMTLKDKINEEILKQALNNVIDRFPTFKYKLKQGLFWCYFKQIEVPPLIEKDFNNPMLRIRFKNHRDYLFRVRYYENRIAVEFFHALTDGTGAIKFLSTLVGEYIKLNYKTKITYNNYVLNPYEKVSSEEYRDDFKKYARKVGKLLHEKPAYHYHGTPINSDDLNVITGIMNTEDLKKITKKYNCTITCLITSLFILSIQELYNKDPKKNNKPIKVSIPVNLRNYYESKTMRNFSSYINVDIDTKYGNYSFEEIIKIVKNNMELNLTEKVLNAKISANVKISENYFIRLLPMFIKKYIISFTERMMGDRYSSNTLSNLGNIILPQEVEKYILDLGMAIGKSRGKPSSSAMVGYNGKVYLTITRKIKESEFERILFTTLVKMGVPVLIESNRRLS